MCPQNYKNRLDELVPGLSAALSREVRAVGIDLGTTNSTVAEVVLKPGAPAVCRTLDLDQPTREGVYTSPLVPSVVAILPDGTVRVGEGAKRLRAFPHEYGLSFEKTLFYDTKNEMGLLKTYHRASPDFDHASKIAGHVLRFLANAANLRTGAAPDAVSVTVPASFQLNQRRDTLLAARSAGLQIADDDLLDEPTAALTDFFLTDSDGINCAFPPGRTRPALCVVFDFGGGTCDVSVIQVARQDAARQDGGRAAVAPPPAQPSGGLSLSQLSISRYHRLGGGDIDAAIVHEVLIPALLAENGLSPLDLTWAQKKKGLEPQLLGKAEALKIALCVEIARLVKFKKYDVRNDNSGIVARQPSIACVLGDRTLRLSQPSLNAAQFESLLMPFLDADFLYVKESEFRLSQSVIAPLADALGRARRPPEDVDFCLLVGGSTLIPHVMYNLQLYMPNCTIGYFDSPLDSQLAVARGAAWNAAIKAATGRPLIQPVLQDGIALATHDGRLDVLIPSGTALPFPPDGSFLSEKLMVPEFPDAPPGSPRRLRFEIRRTEDRQVISIDIWRIPEEAAPGDEIVLEYRFTAGKQFECRAYLPAHPSRPLERSVENPLVNISNPNTLQVRIEELEEKLRRDAVGDDEDEKNAYIQLADWYADLKQREKALDYLRVAQTKARGPDAEILNYQGINFAELGDSERAKKAFLEAAKASPWNGPLFNLAAFSRKWNRIEDALGYIDQALARSGPEGTCLGLKSIILEEMGLSEDAKKTAVEALGLFAPLPTLTEWELNWFRTVAKKAGSKSALEAVDKEAQDRVKRIEDAIDDIPRPALWSDTDARKRKPS